MRGDGLKAKGKSSFSFLKKKGFPFHFFYRPSKRITAEGDKMDFFSPLLFCLHGLLIVFPLPSLLPPFIGYMGKWDFLFSSAFSFPPEYGMLLLLSMGWKIIKGKRPPEGGGVSEQESSLASGGVVCMHGKKIG